MKKNIILIVCIIVASFATFTLAHFVKPDKGDISPVCGMNVSEHLRWVAVIMFSDGKHVKLHGPKNMFTYYFNLEKYDKKYKQNNIATLHVTDYLTEEPIKAETAHYVINSNIQGPMGDELISLKDKISAESFNSRPFQSF
jgi:nitrous oxide reductase accessory protein NosL